MLQHVLSRIVRVLPHHKDHNKQKAAQTRINTVGGYRLTVISVRPLAVLWVEVITKTALSGQSKEVYVEYVMKGRPLPDVAREFGLTKNYVRQIKARIDRAVAAIVSEYGA